MNTKLLYIDIETTQKGKIKDVGALFGNLKLHTKHIKELKPWIEEATYISGHNIIAHDIPLISNVLGKQIFQNKLVVDTLLWSPILFNENPYHKLVKGYKIANDAEYNNPLSDCILTADLLSEEINAFRKLPAELKYVYSRLLRASTAHKSFLNLVKFESNIDGKLVLQKVLDNLICINTEVRKIALEHPVELAYAIAVITANESSILPAWVRNVYPKTQEILDKIRFNYCGSVHCEYCNSNLNPRKALYTYFGYDNFRKFDETARNSLQEETVKAGVESKSFVAVFPTGGGKSLTFQLPALMKGSLLRQLTVVISPLVSLMKDQVDNLERKFGITKAIAINGLLSPLERQQAIERVEKGDAQLLYISPESLRSPTILRLLKKRSIARFVIDEAHCFSSWGQDFRVDYLYIGEFIKQLQSETFSGKIPVSCFTATAKPQVIQDIKAYFSEKLGLELEEYITRANRKNLHYEVIKVEDPNRKMGKLLSLLDACEKPAIVYASRTKRVEEIHALIKEADFSVAYFHGKLDKDVKKLQMESFMNDEKEIIVATSAFGMGVDKDDVKTVIHYNISDSLENYVQEAGRAGRNEDIKAKCYVLFNEDDLNKHFSLLQQTKINHKEIQQVWQALKYFSRYKPTKNISASALQIAQKAGWDTEIKDLETKVKTSIAAMEDQGFLMRTQNSPKVFANSLLFPKLEKAREVINNSELTDSEKDKCARVLQYIYKHEETRVDYLSDLTALKIKEVYHVIDLLRSLKILGDARDLTAFIHLVQSKNGSKNILQRYVNLEKALVEFLQKDIKITMRQLNQFMIDSKVEKTSVSDIKNILNYWEIRGFIKKNRINRENETYAINVKKYNELLEDIAWRHNLAVDVIDLLIQCYHAQEEKQANAKKMDLPVGFSMLELKTKNEDSGLFGAAKNYHIRQYERTLLFLNKIRAIQLEGGFMVYYNRLNIREIDLSIPRFTKTNYEKIATHYLQKTQQIHIVGEYAKRRLQNYESALIFVNEYFSLPYEDFLQKYFPKKGQRARLDRAISNKRFKKIFEELDTDQMAVVKDNVSDNILVLAGPGSGKTRVLVHKIASLLLLEDIKPEQFLMLTFSKAASLEFRDRTMELVPEYARFIKITTFHGFCFQLLGQLGDLEKSQNIIKDCIQAIKNEDIDITSIENKSVLLLDEFQDVSADEWELIQLIIEKAGNIRVIAVGDDDQNIYEFRGSSNKNMLNFYKNYKAKPYALIKNYRSSSDIVTFNNEILKSIPNRIKTKTLVPSKDQSIRKVALIRYHSNHLEQSLVAKLVQDNYNGKRAVLVRTNKQALLIKTFLENAGQKTKLITGLGGFEIGNLFEIRTFTNYLQNEKTKGGFILDSVWNDAKTKFMEVFKENTHIETCSAVMQRFEKSYPKAKYLSDWYDYVREIKMQDVADLQKDKEAVTIATIHKAKGKEYDHVYLLLEDYKFSTNEAKRVVYVGCSRAKKTLQIHCNSNFFDRLDTNILNIKTFEGNTEKPKAFEVVLEHREVNLGSQKFGNNQKKIKALVSGEKLLKYTKQFDNNVGIGLANKYNQNFLFFSKNFQTTTHAIFQKDGYQFIGGNVEYLVFWYDKESDKEYKIVLPRLRYMLNES